MLKLKDKIQTYLNTGYISYEDGKYYLNINTSDKWVGNDSFFRDIISHTYRDGLVLRGENTNVNKQLKNNLEKFIFDSRLSGITITDMKIISEEQYRESIKVAVPVETGIEITDNVKINKKRK
jgi:hypothetical protein